MHTNKDGMLVLDRHQDYFLDGVELSSDSGIAIEFHRKFDTCDNDDYLIDVSKAVTSILHVNIF